MDAYGHLRILVSLILGMAITRILSGLSRRLQEPHWTDRTYSQMVWSVVLLLNAIHFWWWEFALRHITVWNFWIYIFVLAYTSLFFLMSVILYPDHVQPNAEREDFFVRRRHIFFIIFGLSFIFDVFDTLIKGVSHLEELGDWYLVRTGLGLVLALIAIKVNNNRYLAWIGAFWLIISVLWITALYSDLM